MAFKYPSVASLQQRPVQLTSNPHDEDGEDTDILEGMARAIWVTSWASWVESLSKEERKREGVPSLSGGDLDELAPETTPESAYEAARDLYLLMSRANGKTCGELLEEACRADGCTWNSENAELFGHYLAMQAMGEGVSWFDDHAEFRLKFPDRGFEAHYDDGEVWWSPQVRSRQNPAGGHRGVTQLAIGDLVRPHNRPSDLYRVTTKLGHSGFVILPYQRSGKEMVITLHQGVWTSGAGEIWTPADAPERNPAARGWNLGDPMIIGTYAPGSRVQLAKHDTKTNSEKPGDWVVIVRNNARTAGTMTVKNERNHSTHEVDGRARLFAIDHSRITKEK